MFIKKKPKLKYYILVLAAGVLLIIADLTFSYKSGIKDAYLDFQKNLSLPKAEPRVSIFEDEIPANKTSNNLVPSKSTPPLNTDARGAISDTSRGVGGIQNAQPTKLPTQKNIQVPFILQAPYQIWDAVHEDGCEEASVGMAMGFVKGVKAFTQAEMEASILAIAAFEEKRFGFNKDTDAEQTSIILTEYAKIQNAVKPVTSIDDIKREIAAGKIVIIPANGKALKNPNFKNGGPLYHMLVIKGYTSTSFVTNDPGTRRGADYVYNAQLLFDAIHDFNNGDVVNGEKVMIVVE